MTSFPLTTTTTGIRRDVAGIDIARSVHAGIWRGIAGIGVPEIDVAGISIPKIGVAAIDIAGFDVAGFLREVAGVRPAEAGIGRDIAGVYVIGFRRHVVGFRRDIVARVDAGINVVGFRGAVAGFDARIGREVA